MGRDAEGARHEPRAREGNVIPAEVVVLIALVTSGLGYWVGSEIAWKVAKQTAAEAVREHLRRGR